MMDIRYPSARQIQDMEAAARRARAEAFAHLAKAAVSGIKSFFNRPQLRALKRPS